MSRASKSCNSSSMIRLTAVIELEGQSRALTYESNNRSFTIGRDGSSDFQIPLTTVSRSINPDGTVASETIGGRETIFQYDALQRVTRTQLRDVARRYLAPENRAVVVVEPDGT